MTWHCLAHVRPLDKETGNRVDVRVTSADLREITGLNGLRWEPVITEAPVIRLSLFNGDFQAAIEPGDARLPLAIEELKKTYPNIDRYYWAGAPVTIYAGKVSDAWPWNVIFEGDVARYERKAQTLLLAAEVDQKKFELDVTNLTYAGTTGAEGGADFKNKVKPLVIGLARNVEPVLINVIDSVYQFSAYGPIEAVNNLYERGSDFGAPVADYADYAALVAATVEPGTWATCLAEGMVRLGAPAYGVITGDVLGHEVAGATPRLTGAIIKELAAIAGISAGDLETASLDAMDAAVPYNVNLVVTARTNFLDLARSLALPCNYQAGVSLTGKFFVAGVNPNAATSITLDAQGKALPQVTETSEKFVSPPYFKTTMGAARSWRVHTFDEIAFYAPLIDLGPYSPTTVYREGNIVTDAGGTKWLYTSATPSAGNAPVAGSAFWEIFGGGGIEAVRFPNTVSPGAQDGSLYYDALGRTNIKQNGALLFGASTLGFLADDLVWNGYLLVQDQDLASSIASLQELDDDGILTIDEKIRVLIPENSRLEAEYQGILTQANAIGLSITALTAARAAWIALRDGLIPGWNDTTKDTTINRVDWDTILDTYRVEIANAQAALVEPASVQIVPPNTQFVVVNSAGNPVSGEYPRTLSPVVTRGTVNIKTNDEVSYSIITSGITATVDNTNGSGTKGDITATAGASGSIELTVTVNGVPFGPYTIEFTDVSENAATFSANTYEFENRLDNGDIALFQGGTVSIAANSSTNISYGTAYSVAPNVVGGGNDSDTAREGNCGVVGNPGTTQFTINNSTAVTVTANWQAVGKK